MIGRHARPELFTEPLRVDDDDLDDEDDPEDEDDDDNDDDEDDDEDEEEDSDEPETWQVQSAGAIPLKGASGLTSGIELPRLAGIFQLF